MSREAALYDSTNGSIFLAYLLIREGGANIPPNWVKRSRVSRKSREKELGKLLKAGELDAANFVREWEVAYKKECFYRGLRALLDLQRDGQTRI